MIENNNHEIFYGGTSSLDKHEDFAERGASTSFSELKNDPEVIIRQEHRLLINSTEELNKAKGLFEELRGFGVGVPKLDVVIGPGAGGEKSVFTVTERIHGEPLDRLVISDKDLTPNEVKELELFFKNLIEYFRLKYRNGEPRLSDIGKMTQYVFGRRKGETRNRVYLVDVAPNYDTDKRGTLAKSQMLIDLAHAGIALRNFHDLKGIDWRESRLELLDLVDELRPEDVELNKPIIREIHKALTI